MTRTLELSRLRAGRWEAVLSASEPIEIEVRHLERVLSGLECIPDGAGRWQLSLPVPAELLSDGVQTFVVCEKTSGEVLGQFTIVTGVPLEHDLRAEINLLRAELDMLKRAFRRHCVETAP
jgi:hypothetical protein